MIQWVLITFKMLDRAAALTKDPDKLRNPQRTVLKLLAAEFSLNASWLFPISTGEQQHAIR